MPKHRIFVSIDIPEELKKNENWHITVVFCGYLDNEKLEKLKEATERISQDTKGFELTPDKIMLKDKRMVWLTFKYSLDFVKLHKRFSEFSQHSFNPRPHVTLARLKNSGYPDFNKLLPAKPFIVKSINIMESHLSSKGPKYELICRNYLK